MNLVRTAGSGSPRAPDLGGDLFDAPSYSDWMRGALRARAADPDVAILFESTIAEPTDELMQVVRGAFADPVTSRYVSVFADGNLFAVEALARRYGVEPDWLFTTTGATGALNTVLGALVGPGDQVLVERPGFDVLARLAAEAGAEVGEFHRRAPDFRIDLDELTAKLTPRTRAVLITNLHNPSGVRLPPAEIAAVADRLAASGVTLVVDEVYADFAADAGDPPAAKLGRNVVTVSSLTKVFGLFALRFGWIVAHPELLRHIRGGAPDGDMGVSKLAHAVAAHVLEQPAAFEAHWRKVLAATRPLVERRAAALCDAGLLSGRLPPFGCMYFPAVQGVTDTRELAQRLFREHRVLVAPGEYFGAPGHLRIGFGTDPQAVEIGLERLADALSQSG